MVELKFTAVAPVVQGWKYGIDQKKHQYYDCSFSITFDQSKVNPNEVNVMVQSEMNRLRMDHPNSQVINQGQRQF